MKGKWAKGIAPRFFAWIIKDKLAVSERPGGYARNHRRVRRQEEILWLRGEGFSRVVSLLTSPHNLHAYDELDMAWAHIPFGSHDDPHVVLPDLYAQLRDWMSSGERLLVHHEELSDRLMGVVAGYLRWSGLVPAGPQAISVVERIMHRQMGPDGRELVAMAPQLAGAGGCAVPITTRGRMSEDNPSRPKGAARTSPISHPSVPPPEIDPDREILAAAGADESPPAADPVLNGTAPQGAVDTRAVTAPQGAVDTDAVPAAEAVSDAAPAAAPSEPPDPPLDAEADPQIEPGRSPAPEPVEVAVPGDGVGESERG